MAELAMPDPARGLAVNYQPDADPGPNRDIGEIVEPLPRAPANLGERRAVDVGVEPHRHRERRCDLAEHVGIAPAGLVGRQDMPVSRRSGSEIERPERGDPEGGEAGNALDRKSTTMKSKHT